MSRRFALVIAVALQAAACGGAAITGVDLEAQTRPVAPPGVRIQVNPAELQNLLNGSSHLTTTLTLPIPNQKALNVALERASECEDVRGNRAFRSTRTGSRTEWYVKVVGGAGQATILALGDNEAWVYTVLNAELGTLIARRVNQIPGVCQIDVALQARLKKFASPAAGPVVRRWPASPRMFRFAVSTTWDFQYVFSDAATVAATNVHLASAVFEKFANISLCPIIDARAIESAPNQIYDHLTDTEKAARGHELFTRDLNLQFDLGQVFDVDGGGWGQPGGLCDKKLAGSGVTNWRTTSQTDRENIWLLTHEIAHQLGAAHTFNGDFNGRSPESAVELDAGRSLLGYPLDHTGLWFHPFTVGQILTHVATVTGANASCGRSIGTIAASAPTMKDGTVIVPSGTAIRLSAEGSGATTFAIGEITNAGAPDSTPPWFYAQGTAPSPEFVFPSANDVAPSKPTRLRFLSLGVDQAGSMGFGVQDVEVTTAGPFVIGAQQGWQPSSTATLTWKTGGTEAAPFSAQWVDAWITTDPHQVDWRPLKMHVPNTGTASVTLGATDRGNHVRVRLLVPGQAFLATSPEFQVP
jgi:hypothetical protein